MLIKFSSLLKLFVASQFNVMALVTAKLELNKNEINEVLSASATASHRHSNKYFALANGSN